MLTASSSTLKMSTKRLIPFLLLTLVLSLTGLGYWITCIIREPVIATLKVELDNNKVYALLKFKNRSPWPFYLNKVNACLDDKLSNDVFVVELESNRQDYMLPRIKRLTVGERDYVMISPGSVVQTKVRLDQGYKLAHGEHQYSVRYDATHYNPERNRSFDLTSNVAKFRYNLLE